MSKTGGAKTHLIQIQLSCPCGNHCYLAFIILGKIIKLPQQKGSQSILRVRNQKINLLYDTKHQKRSRYTTLVQENIFSLLVRLHL